jgi:hypothetical protein
MRRAPSCGPWTRTRWACWTPGPVGLELLDLQATPSRGVLFGIAVDGRYGRILSQFTFVEGNNTIGVQHLFRLPDMWYVNASTLDQRGQVYYGLINNFPGRPNSTTAQQLVVGQFANVSTPSATVVALPTSAGYTVHFVSHSPSTGALVALAVHESKPGAHFLMLDPVSGTLTPLADDATATDIGPLAADPSKPLVCALLRYAEAPLFQQACVDISTHEVVRNPVSGDSAGIFAASTTGFN